MTASAVGSSRRYAPATASPSDVSTRGGRQLPHRDAHSAALARGQHDLLDDALLGEAGIPRHMQGHSNEFVE
jgi:hypothetical protein